jgi:predicted nucleic acid-binding protein
LAVRRFFNAPTRLSIVDMATGAHAPPLRAMDAIHLATALTMREDLGAVFVYDSDLSAAARSHQLNSLSPQ